MPSKRDDAGTAVVVAGIGVACGLGHGKQALRDGLYEARDVFSPLQRPGREAAPGARSFIGVEMPDPAEVLPPRVARTSGLSGRVAAAVIDEAWRDAGLDAVAPERIGLVVGGSNLMTREMLLARDSYAERLAYLPPRFGHAFLDTDICGLCTSAFPIRAFAHTVGAASASGAVAVLMAAEAVRSGRADACIALGAMQDLSSFDLQGLRAMGAMGSDRFAEQPGRACRPMDADRDGFIYGEASAALVVTCADGPAAAGRGYGVLLGGAQVTDGSRGPEPNGEGQQRAARTALAAAGLEARDIDYVNGHATGTPQGDDTELETYRALGLEHAWINATKSIVGHGLSAAGTIELAAVLIQMRDGRLHATRNLERPLDDAFRWVGPATVPHRIRQALKLSFGFGGTDVAIVVQSPEAD